MGHHNASCEQTHEQRQVHDAPRVEAHAQVVDEEQLKLAGQLDRAFDECFLNKPKQGNRHGKGTCEFPEGVYSGAWVDDRKEGFGTFEFSNGDTYEGEWLKDWRHGRGKCSYHTGEVYDGEWVDDMRKGEGDETIPRNLDEEDAKMATTGSLSGTLRVFPEPARPRVPDASP